MPTNQFENARVTEGTMPRGAQHNATLERESAAISRDDVRDGFAEPAVGRQADYPDGRRTRLVLTASTVTGDRVRNPAGEELGTIHEIMLDIESGRIAYAVLSFGGFLGIGDKLFAVPWSSLQISTAEHEFIFDVDRKTLEAAPGFDKNNWPDMAARAFGREIHSYYGRPPYWDDSQVRDSSTEYPAGPEH